jgi:hypothetical protein
MNDEQIKYMVNRFLTWRLPENFNPDAGISFKSRFNERTAHPMKHEPVGTNLFDATQAEEMVRYLVDGMPTDELRLQIEAARQIVNAVRSRLDEIRKEIAMPITGPRE